MDHRTIFYRNCRICTQFVYKIRMNRIWFFAYATKFDIETSMARVDEEHSAEPQSPRGGCVSLRGFFPAGPDGFYNMFDLLEYVLLTFVPPLKTPGDWSGGGDISGRRMQYRALPRRTNAYGWNGFVAPRFRGSNLLLRKGESLNTSERIWNLSIAKFFILLAGGGCGSPVAGRRTLRRAKTPRLVTRL